MRLHDSREGRAGRSTSTATRVAPLAPIGYLGDPNVPHSVVGSHTGNNLFRVAGPNVGGSGINSIQTTLFAVSGKLFQ